MAGYLSLADIRQRLTDYAETAERLAAEYEQRYEEKYKEDEPGHGMVGAKYINAGYMEQSRAYKAEARAYRDALDMLTHLKRGGRPPKSLRV